MPINLRRAADMCRNVQPEIRQGEELPQHAFVHAVGCHHVIATLES